MPFVFSDLTWMTQQIKISCLVILYFGVCFFMSCRRHQLCCGDASKASVRCPRTSTSTRQRLHLLAGRLPALRCPPRRRSAQRALPSRPSRMPLDLCHPRPLPPWAEAARCRASTGPSCRSVKVSLRCEPVVPVAAQTAGVQALLT